MLPSSCLPVYQVLQSKNLMDNRHLRPEAGLADSSQPLPIRVINQPAIEHASIEPQQGLGVCY